MCTWSYAHYHHLPPCNRSIEMAVNYSYCQFATKDPTTGGFIPCESTHFGDDVALLNQIDYNDPCAIGGCLISPDCHMGVCRVAQLGGRWICCQCGGQGNESRQCMHRMRSSPDTFCYHEICEGCRADPAGAALSASPSSASPSSSATAGSASTAGSRSGMSSSGTRRW
ncbi:hypothetical protein VTJ83DRAFT_3752 [Remersonia thermophila]|uniref:CCHC-type domain-containing protein n=1 Tax=Remersonia thermophila TaxID=72144 RepID=A0ABR4DEY9_9PEZI